MKQSDIKPGMRAMLSLGRRGAVAVTVVSRSIAAGYVTYDGTQRVSRDVWNVTDSSGHLRRATARQLSPMPAPVASTPEERAHYATFDRSLRTLDARKGQTTDMGDVVIETTLHRLG